MLFNSIDYLIFFPIVIIIYFIFPSKHKSIWLLISSYYFYMSWNIKYGLLIFFSTFISYLCGIFLEHIKTHKLTGIKIKKVIITISILFILSFLFYFKYFNFTLLTFSKLLRILHINVNFSTFDIVLPVGISFFTFQSIGYMIDVYRNDVPAEKNFIKYALFISFFPQLVAGPIERSKNLLNQFNENKKFNTDNFRIGLLTMGYGLFLKIVVADNISVVIDPLFNSPNEYTGMELLVASVLFAFQIYCDFEGYTKLAIGSARILGYKLNENFNAPYWALSVKDFWRRWHISLTSWFRDYLYIPLGGSKKGKFRKQVNTMIIFLSSGLWHGAALHYVFWGGLNGFLSVLQDLLEPYKVKMYYKLKIDTTKTSYKIFQRIFTFAAIDITWIFFRVSLSSGFFILQKIITDFNFAWFINNEYFHIFSTPQTMLTIFFSIAIILAIDGFKYVGEKPISIILQQQAIFRWVIYWILILIILYWGVYGDEYEQTQFIYFQF